MTCNLDSCDSVDCDIIPVMSDVDPPPPTHTHTHIHMHMNSYVGEMFLLQTKITHHKTVASFPGTQLSITFSHHSHHKQQKVVLEQSQRA